MALPKLQPDVRVSIAEYLALERAAEERHIYLDGKIIAMAGESGEHGDISVNLVIALGNQLKDTLCRVRAKDTKVCSGPVLQAGETKRCLFSYPDLVVVCNEPQYLDAFQDVLMNPKVIVEVLSESTEAFDRGEKFTRFQTWNESLTDYILVAPDKPQIEHFTRQADGAWTYRLTTGMDASVAIPSIKCTLTLTEVYDRVVFSQEQ